MHFNQNSLCSWFSRLLLIIFGLSLLFILSMQLPLPMSGNRSDMKCSKRREYFHNETQQCYKERMQGPCPGNLIFQKVDSVFGDCDCNPDSILPLVYHEESNKCYETYKQSYCPPGQWLIFDENLEPICTQNPCGNETLPNSDSEDHPVIHFKGKCVPLNRPSPEICGDHQRIVRIKWDEVLPECVLDVQEMSVASTSQLKCKAGTRRDKNGRCRRIVTLATSTTTPSQESNTSSSS